MSQTVIEIDNLWKKYRLGALGTGTFRHDFNRWWHRVRGKSDPYAQVGDVRGAGRGPRTEAKDWGEELEDDEMWALRGVTFDVKQGEILGIIGRNGAGKSTLLKILSRVTAPTTGEVRVKGRIASLLEVGTGFHPDLTGRENIFLNGAILGMTKAEIRRKLDEIVDFSGVERYIDTPVKRYSSGMYVRLAFAVAAHLEPEILIVDEVLAVGDAEFQKKCLGKMKDVSGREGRTVIFVSHNMKAVDALCTRATYLAAGRVQSIGSVPEQLNAYLRDTTSNKSRLEENPVCAGELVQIQFLKFNPNPCKSCANLEFEVGLECDDFVRIGDLAILIYSRDETRVAVIDLRKNGQPIEASPGPLRISGCIKPLQLVAGEYRIGLYLTTSDFSDNIFDLARLTVSDVRHEDGHIPYDEAHRGFVELRHESIVESL